MVKKLVLGFSALVVLVATGIAVMVMLTWDSHGVDGARGTKSDEHSLGQILAKEFSGQPEVEFMCLFPVVGTAPCLLPSDMGRHEVILTFTNYELPQGITLEEQARRIAIAAFTASAFARGSDNTEVIFKDVTESTSVSRKYSFSGEELAAGDVAAPIAVDNSKPIEE
jgi:hypothetical protein